MKNLDLYPKMLLLFALLLLSQEVAKAQRIVEIPGGRKSAMAVVNPNLIYIGMQVTNEVLVYDGQQLSPFPISLAGNAVLSLAYYQNTLWVGTRAGLFRADSNNFTIFNRVGGQLPSDTVHAMTVFGSNLMIGTAAGLVVYTGQHWVPYRPINNGQAQNRVTYMKVHDNKLCLVVDSQAVIVDGNSFQTIPNPPGHRISHAIPHPGGGLLVGNRDSVFFRTLAGQYHTLPMGRSFEFGVGDAPDRMLIVGENRLYTLHAGKLSYRNIRTFPLGATVLQKDAQGGIHILGLVNLVSLTQETFYDPNPNSWNSKRLNINQVDAFLDSKGDFFNTFGWSPGQGYNVPKSSSPGQSLHTIFNNNFWVGGIAPGGQLHQSGLTLQNIPNLGKVYQAGLLNAQGQTDSASRAQFDRVWEIHRFDIEAFKQAWQQGRVQNGQYLPPLDIREWPGNRPGSNELLAPFFDANNDGIYNYLQGDYPLIKGDQALWWAFNDQSAERQSGQALGVEMHCMAYSYICDQATAGDTIINYTTFYDVKIVNRSATSYAQTYLGSYMDGNFSGFHNQAIYRSDVDGNGFYFFHSTDEGDGGYGQNPPAQGFYLLKGPLADPGDGIDNNRNGQVDEAGERFGISTFMVANRNTEPFGWPTQDAHFYNYSRGIWKDSSALVFGGFGYPGTVQSTNIPAKYVFPGLSDPNGWGIGGSISNPVSAPFDWFTGSTFTPGNPNVPISSGVGIMGIGPLTFAPGQALDLTYALIFSRGNNATAQGSVDRLLQHDAPLVRQWYAQNSFPSCLDLTTVSVAERPLQPLKAHIYPNPVQSQWQVALLEEGIAVLEIYDMQGRCLRQQQLEGATTHQFSSSDLSAGTYLVRILQNGKLKQHKLVKTQ